MKRLVFLLALPVSLGLGLAGAIRRQRLPTPPDPRLLAYTLAYTAAPSQLQFYYQDEHGRRFGSLGRLRAWLTRRGQTLAFVLNGGMYRPGGRRGCTWRMGGRGCRWIRLAARAPFT